MRIIFVLFISFGLPSAWAEATVPSIDARTYGVRGMAPQTLKSLSCSEGVLCAAPLTQGYECDATPGGCKQEQITAATESQKKAGPPPSAP